MNVQEQPASRPGSTPGSASGSNSRRPAGAERLAWAVGGAAVALGMGATLSSAFGGAASGGTAFGGPAPTVGAPASAATQEAPRSMPMSAGGMSADSNSRMIAVTGVDITGQSVLFLVDTIDKQLAVYQASGGAPGTQSIKLVGARRIDLDLQLDGFNDKTVSEGRSLTYKDLAARFGARFNETK